jgi:hypothetical protein
MAVNNFPNFVGRACAHARRAIARIKLVGAVFNRDRDPARHSVAVGNRSHRKPKRQAGNASSRVPLEGAYSGLPPLRYLSITNKLSSRILKLCQTQAKP